MNCFFKKLAFSLAVCTSVVPGLEATKMYGKHYGEHHRLQLDNWSKQPIRYKMSIDVFEDIKTPPNSTISIKLITPGKKAFTNTYFVADAMSFGWDPQWMSPYDRNFSHMELYILPNTVKYKGKKLPLISRHLRSRRGESMVFNIFKETHPMWNFVNKYLSCWVKGWRGPNNIKSKMRRFK